MAKALLIKTDDVLRYSNLSGNVDSDKFVVLQSSTSTMASLRKTSSE